MVRTLFLLFLLFAVTAEANESVTLYQLSGGVQCLDSRDIAPEDAADLLRGQGVTVIAAERRQLPLPIGKQCGAPTGDANVITVAAADWTTFSTKNPDAGGYGIWVFDEGRVQVFMHDGTLQCGMGQEIPLQEMAKMLTGAGVRVLESRKGTDGLVHISVCGASTGNINVYTIAREDLPAAQALGFRMLISRELTQSIKPPVKRKAGILSRTLPRSTLSPKGAIPLLW